jgi:predicted metal-binding membrane protein
VVDAWLIGVAAVSATSFAALWIWTDRYPSHDIRPPLEVFLGMWVLMTAGMMLPSAFPLLTALKRVRRAPAFSAALAYIATWAVAGAIVWLGLRAVDGMVGFATNPFAPQIAGAGLAAAGLFGLSPLARSCLIACRRPAAFVARYWTGRGSVHLQGAHIGAAYGVSCVGCCVPMIGMMFVTGAAHMLSMFGLAIVMILTKTSVHGPLVASALALALIAAGLATGMGWIAIPAPHH